MYFFQSWDPSGSKNSVNIWKDEGYTYKIALFHYEKMFQNTADITIAVEFSFLGKV